MRNPELRYFAASLRVRRLLLLWRGCVVGSVFADDHSACKCGVGVWVGPGTASAQIKVLHPLDDPASLQAYIYTPHARACGEWRDSGC